MLILLLILLGCSEGPAAPGTGSAKGAERAGDVAELALKAEDLAKDLEAACDYEVGGLPDEERIARMKGIVSELEELSSKIELAVDELEDQARADAQR